MSTTRDRIQDLNDAREGNIGVTQEALNDLQGVFDNGGAKASTNNSVVTVGLSGLDDLLQPGVDTESLSKYIETTKESLKEAKIDIKRYKLDKDQFGLGFSCVLYAHKTNDNKVYYFISLLEATGREPLAVRYVVEELQVKQSTAILVTADAFDNKLFETVEIMLEKAFPGGDFISLEGVVVPAKSDVVIVADIISKYVHNRMVVKSAIDAGKASDLTIAAIRRNISNGSLNLDISFNTGLTINSVGRSIRSDFNIESNINNQMSARSLHNVMDKKRISMVSGYLDFIISEEVNNYTGQIKKVAEPMIILNEFIGKAPTLNYALVGIINAAAFTTRQNLYALLMEKDAGPLNFLFNYGGDANKFGDKISFKDPSAKPEVINEIIRHHIKQNPIFTIEVELYGADYSHMNAFAALKDPQAGPLANQDILNAASELVGAPMETTTVLGNEGSLIPIGEYVDANGEIRDLREIDLTFVCNYANDPSIVYDYIYSCLPDTACINATNKSAYVLRLEVINKLAATLNIKPTITGKVARIPLNGQFVAELVTKAMAKGYAPRIENNNIVMNETNNLQNIAQIYAGATVGNLNLGSYQTGPQYNMPGVTTYMYR